MRSNSAHGSGQARLAFQCPKLCSCLADIPICSHEVAQFLPALASPITSLLPQTNKLEYLGETGRGEAIADHAVSLAKSVEGAVTKALAAIEEEATLRKSTQNDLAFITGEFQMMQSFLNVADEERARNNVVRTWVRQVRDLAYNVEDCIEYVIHLDKASD